MNRVLMLAVFGAAVAAMTISATPKDDELTARWAKVHAAAVYVDAGVKMPFFWRFEDAGGERAPEESGARVGC